MSNVSANHLNVNSLMSSYFTRLKKRINELYKWHSSLTGINVFMLHTTPTIYFPQ